jgi:hypothetical protein
MAESKARTTEFLLSLAQSLRTKAPNNWALVLLNRDLPLSLEAWWRASLLHVDTLLVVVYRRSECHVLMQAQCISAPTAGPIGCLTFLARRMWPSPLTFVFFFVVLFLQSNTFHVLGVFFFCFFFVAQVCSRRGCRRSRLDSQRSSLVL